jgi:hypothetical protein
MEKTCPFWPDERQCGSQACGIENCDDEVPEAIKVGNYELCRHGNLHVQANENSRVCSGVAAMQHGNTLDPLITHISGDTHVLLNDMDTHEFMDENKFCDVDGKVDPTLRRFLLVSLQMKFPPTCITLIWPAIRNAILVTAATVRKWFGKPSIRRIASSRLFFLPNILCFTIFFKKFSLAQAESEV